MATLPGVAELNQMPGAPVELPQAKKPDDAKPEAKPAEKPNGVHEERRFSDRERRNSEGALPGLMRAGEEREQKVGVLEDLNDIHDDLIKDEEIKSKLRHMMSLSQKAPDIFSLPADPDTKLGQARILGAKMLGSNKFDMAVGVVILINSVTIGAEIGYTLPPASDISAFKAVEHVFLVCYVLELLLRFFVQGVHCLKNPWVQFDAVLVSLGVLTTWLIEPFLDTEGDGSKLGPIMVLRVFRLLRLVRAVRLLVQFQTLWLLVRGLLSSAGTMMSTFALIMLLLYIFACVAVELITKEESWREDPVFADLVDEHFRSIPRTMLTLTTFATRGLGGSAVSQIMIPMVERHVALTIFFACFILMVSVTLLNLVTAVLVNGAIEQADNDKEAMRFYKAQKLKVMLPKIRDMFHELDADGSGDLSLDELVNAPEEVRVQLLQYMKGDDILELFECIDTDDSGSIDVEEFCDGLARLTLSETPVETLRLMRQVQVMRREGNFKELHKTLERIEKATSGKGGAAGGGAAAPSTTAPRADAERLNRVEEQVSEMNKKLDRLLERQGQA